MITIEQQYQQALREQAYQAYLSLASDLLPSLTDLTCLDPAASAQSIAEVATQAEQTNAASICVLPEHLGWLPAIPSLRRTTVFNFPHGDDALSDLLKNIDQQMLETPLQEIDFVFPYQQYLAGDETKALHLSLTLARHCQEHGLISKVIIETGALPTLDIIYKLSWQLLSQPIDFIKTSTGKIHTGATLPAAFAILSALKTTEAHAGIKFSGGIRTPAQAQSYLQLTTQCLPNRPIHASWVRFGASKVLTPL